MHSKRSIFAARAGLALALSASMVFTSTPVATPAYAESSSSLQSQLNSAKKELLALQKKVDQSQAVLGKTQYELDATRTKIKETQKRIDENEEKLKAASDELQSQVSSSYKRNSSGSNTLSLVFDSDNFGDLVSRVFYANKVAEKESSAIQTVRDLQTSLAQDKETLEQKKQEQEKLYASQKSESAAAEQAAEKQSSYVNGLSSEVQKALQEEREREAQEALKKSQEAIANANNNGNASSNTGSVHGTDNSGNSHASSNTSRPNKGNTYVKPSTGGSSHATGGSSHATGNQRSIAVNAALSQVGKPYGHGNNGSNWDCNGLTHWAWAQAGVEIPGASGHYGYGQFQWMKRSGRWVTSVSALKPGDLVFYSYDGGATTYHVAMYIGGGQVVHANGWYYGVHTSSVYFDDGFCGGGSPI